MSYKLYWHQLETPRSPLLLVLHVFFSFFYLLGTCLSMCDTDATENEKKENGKYQHGTIWMYYERV